MYNEYSKGQTIVYTFGWIMGGLVVIAIIAAFYFGVTGNDQYEDRRYQICVENGGTYVDGTEEMCVNPNGKIEKFGEKTNG